MLEEETEFLGYVEKGHSKHGSELERICDVILYIVLPSIQLFQYLGLLSVILGFKRKREEGTYKKNCV